MAESKVSMKLLVDSKEKRELFAEAGKDCVDFLFHILSLPAATIIRLLHDQGMEGSLPNLYKSLEDLNSAYIQPDSSKDAILYPLATSVPLLALEDAPTAKKFYRSSCCNYYFSDNSSAVCPNHPSYLMTSNITYVSPPPAVEGASDGGGLVKGVVTYMVMDDLTVKPMSTISSIALLTKFNVKDVSLLEEKFVTLGMTEAVRLLKTSLQSKSVLTDVFCT